jgi:RNA-directed DNA polymerase
METPRSTSISTKLDRIATLAKNAPELAFTTLAHHIDIDWLREAYRRTRKDGATGIDGQTADEYASNLEENLRALIDRVHAGLYRAPPVRRVHIPKGDGKQTRPIGIPTFEDKVLQRAVAMLLEAIYEQDFLDCSYGFRPGRSAHQALERLQNGAVRMAGGWILEVDIQKFFDSLDHAHLRQMLRRRIRDGVLLRLIGKWLNAGVLEDGMESHPNAGTPQGGVISPLLANVYLHEVLDVWFEREARPRLDRTALLVRYADDFVMLFRSENDARRVWDVLPKRFAKYGLKLHPEKTRLIEFCRPNRRDPPQGGGRSRPTFEFLGFTHLWGLTRNEKWTVRRRTSSARFSRSLRRINAWCKHHRHEPLAMQHRTLAQKLRGHFGYFGIIGNYEALRSFRHWVIRAWRKWLSRRSRRTIVTWARMLELQQRYSLPQPHIGPHQRFT